MTHDKIAVLDFGGQYAHLIANRIRRLKVYSEIRDADTPAKNLKQYKGLILSGGPMSVYAKNAPTCDPKIFKLGVPILGICYGHQLMQYVLGGKVVSGKTKEYGFANLIVRQPLGIFAGLTSPTQVWMSHGDTVLALGLGFEEAGRTPDLPFAAVADTKRHFYGTQFHVEVTHTPEGMKLLDHFLEECGVQCDWSLDAFIQEELELVRQKIGNKKVFLLVSGGVDSTVAFALLEKSLGKDRVYGLLVDHGLMRLNEAAQVKKTLSLAGFNNLHVVDKSELFLSALKGVADPEKKRKIIGDLFWKVKEEQAEKLGLNPDEWIMGQGTIYPDTIETGGTKHADRIKTHHNRVDLMQEMIKVGKVIEPLAQLYKDEVRVLGEKLGLPYELVWRQPFPGPGLGVRILCHAGQGNKEILRFAQNDETDIAHYIRETFLSKDMTAKILPIQSVGVQGDERTYRHPLVLFGGGHNWKQWEQISTFCTNRFQSINRVCLSLLPEKVESFKVHRAYLTKERVSLLQQADAIVMDFIERNNLQRKIWQFPVILAPLSFNAKQGATLILRPVESEEAMTANFYPMNWDLLWKLNAKLKKLPGISGILYDITHKPPGTIEWE